MAKTARVVEQDQLHNIVKRIFMAAGCSDPHATVIADVLLWANLRGVDSHGAMRIPGYLDQIRKGEFDPKAQPSVRPLMPATFILDGARAAGPVCMIQAAAHAIGLVARLVVRAP